MTPTSNQETVDEIVLRSTEALFAAYDLRVAREDLPPPLPAHEMVFTGVIGFTGSGMRGTLVIAPTRTMLERSHAGAHCELRDWAGELANQLLGRVKNQLRNYGVEIFPSTPVVMKGHCLAAAPRDLTLHSFAASPGNVSVWFDAELADGVTLTLMDSQPGPSEGDSILF